MGLHSIFSLGINRAEETAKGVLSAGLEVRNWLIWDKGNVGFHAQKARCKARYEAFLYCIKDERITFMMYGK
jgi:hypothetical protein